MPRPVVGFAVENSITPNIYARIVGIHRPAQLVLAGAAPLLAQHGILVTPSPSDTDDPPSDYAQIDPSLTRLAESSPESPDPGTGYAGFTPAERAAFVSWLATPQHAAPRVWLQLYLAWLETWLFESLAMEKPDRVENVLRELRQLAAWPHWRASEQYGRTTFLALYLAAGTDALREWIARYAPPWLIGIALGRLAETGGALTPQLLVKLAAKLNAAPQSVSMVNLRLESLKMALGTEPLVWALSRAGDTEPTPWRCAHRDFRISVVQRDLLPHLEPHIMELFSGMQEQSDSPAAEEPEVDAAGAADAQEDLHAWRLIVEFGHSRSEYFDFALRKAQKMPGFVALLDENRHIVYRVTFKRSEMRKFWSLWEYVQSWAGTKVYLNGDEVERWKVWPYSQYLQ